MYSALLYVHSYLRWLLLIAVVLTTVRAIVALAGRKPWGPGDQRLGLISTIFADLQLLVGLGLYALSPLLRTAFADFGATMKTPVLRFWAVEHITLALIAVALLHVGRVLSRRAFEDAARHRRIAITFGLSLLAMVAAIPWPMREALGRAWFRL